MTFSDKDLRQLENQLAGTVPTHGRNGGVDLKALLFRLAASENYGHQWTDTECECSPQRFCRHEQAEAVWRKAAGKTT